MKSFDLPEYNGWSNYPTWCVNLWLTNDQGTTNFVLDLLRNVIRSTRATEYLSRNEMIVVNCANELETFAEEWIYGFKDDNFTGLGSDLLSWTLSYVDWKSITNYWLEMIDDIDSYMDKRNKACNE